MNSKNSQHTFTNESASNAYVALGGLYIFLYYAMGAYSPLLTEYFKSIHLTGIEIGTLSSITPVVSLLLQPVWGMICDKFQIRKKALILALIAAACISFLFTFINTYAWVFFTIAFWSIFQCAAIPISDSLTLSYVSKRSMHFGSIRLWGAIGFAIAAFLTALAVQQWGPSAIFYSTGLAYFLAVLFLIRIPDERIERKELPRNSFKKAGTLFKIPRFILFLLCTFFVFGSMNAHNTWFNLYYQHIGGEIATLGLAFLLFAGSEVPCMKLASRLIKKIGLEQTLLFACIVSGARWFFYGSAPSTTIILSLFFLQGLSVGLFLATAAQYVRENTPLSLQVTALAVFASFGVGLGSMFANYTAGWVMEYYGILRTYTFFGISTLLGIIPLLLICYGPWKRNSEETVAE
ncbi:MFS transporter [Brevibacillus laterosporus]|uniref:MFS transporter n=1 Tax=Brevibacillus laterosporus TaxID=1465 RepID=A0AAP3DFQ3_BRELA|nr:MFS transporter [Brevibacillus laterosporus]MCR8980228.1 MFS transporter [Brevibacillus laterosporus]MCZ0807383.1 MFS transporter [Brevibacillus laterosporus]MCZ0825508.1 MFS transporter [Brevibacillus laterosporus]MCZ0849285.1 MFS transporter [Brevibacillus laterosporus]MED1664717.1 MFS transporter [Brevibacillus laterosporus]